MNNFDFRKKVRETPDTTWLELVFWSEVELDVPHWDLKHFAIVRAELIKRGWFKPQGRFA